MIRKALLIAGLAAALLAAKNAAVDSADKLVKEGKFDEAITALETAQKKEPKSAEVKTGLVNAYMAKGDSFMNNKSLPPFQKYPTALRAYRKVSQLDPSNAKAKENVNMIEGIYKSMGRPVPQ